MKTKVAPPPDLYYPIIRIYGYNNGAQGDGLRSALHPGRLHTEPDPARARSARTDRRRAVRGAAAAAVDGQPAPADPRRRGVGDLAGSGHEPAVPHRAAAGRRGAPVVAARAGPGER